MRLYKNWLILFGTGILFLLIGTSANAANISFYDGANKHKGFYWFEVQEKENIQKQITQKEPELVKAKAGYVAAVAYRDKEASRKYPAYPPNNPDYLREWKKVQVSHDKWRQLQLDVRTLRSELERLQ